MLDGLEQVRVENWRMLCGADLAFKDDLSDIEPVAQEISERKLSQAVSEFKKQLDFAVWLILFFIACAVVYRRCM